jgi:uncharacterized protein
MEKITTYGRGIITAVFLGGIRMYQWFLSPLLQPCCRFYPSCSEYAIEAFQTQSVGKACVKSVKRLLRCHPWGKSGYDPV